MHSLSRNKITLSLGLFDLDGGEIRLLVIIVDIIRIIDKKVSMLDPHILRCTLLVWYDPSRGHSQNRFLHYWTDRHCLTQLVCQNSVWFVWPCCQSVWDWWSLPSHQTCVPTVRMRMASDLSPMRASLCQRMSA